MTIVIVGVCGVAVGFVLGYLFYRNNPNKVKTVESVADSMKKHNK
jgi:hypothetical protein